MNWPPRSPDLTPLDFFLWGHIKSLVYRNPIESRRDMELRIQQAFDSITPEMLENSIQSFLRRAQMCVDNGSGHFQQFLRWYKNNLKFWNYNIVACTLLRISRKIRSYKKFLMEIKRHRYHKISKSTLFIPFFFANRSFPSKIIIMNNKKI